MLLSDLPLPIYLNHRVVFDLLAIFEDGLATESSIKWSEKEGESTQAGVEGSAGSRSFLPIMFQIKGSGSKKSETAGAVDVSLSKYHTPTSLFARLKNHIKEAGLLIEFTESTIDLSAIGHGFVELDAVLHRNPVIVGFEAIKQFGEYGRAMFGNFPEERKEKKQRQSGPKQDIDKFFHEIEATIKALNAPNSIEITGTCSLNPPVNIVASTEITYFKDQTLSELEDGEYRIFGKVIRVVTDESQPGIDLMRKTNLGQGKKVFFEHMKNFLNTVGSSRLDIPELTTIIAGPAVQLVPICIYV